MYRIAALWSALAIPLWAAIAWFQPDFSGWPDAPCYADQTAAQGCVNGVQDLSGADMPFSPDWAMFLAGT